ncbi:AMP-dependent synthetase/ligase [Thermodesulfobacteriota bacterium]
MDQQTLPKIFIDQVEAKHNNTFLMHKEKGEWRNVSWKEVGEKVRLITLGLMALGVENGDRVAAISETRPELAYCCTAIANSGAIFTGIYHTNSPNECAHVINDSGAKIIFAENKAQWDKLVEASENTHPLEKIIVIEDIETKKDSLVISLNELCEIGRGELSKQGARAYMDSVLSVKPDDVTAIIYTSGTTGPPKGVMDTNAGVIKNLHEYTKYFPIYSHDRGISFLPMAHALELRNGHWMHIIYGITQVYAESMQALFENVHETEPTFLFTPPRFFEKHYNTIWASLEKAPEWKRKLAHWCLEKGARYQGFKDNFPGKRQNIFDVIAYAIAYFLFFRRVRKTVGKKIRWAGAGGASMAPELLQFFRSCGLPIYEGYGLTEAQGMICANRPGALKVGTVGKPLDGVEIKFTEEGEILANGWIKGKGYWNNAKATEDLYKGGWINTGDLGVMDEDGFLRITGRKKEILITSSGKNISPSFIENLLKMSGFISQAVVFGEGKTYLTALITLNQEEIIKFAHKNNIIFSDFADLTKKQEIIDLTHNEIELKNRELARIEQIKKFTILEDEFRQDREEVTPTFKVKRDVIARLYGDKIDAMYES